MAAVYNTLVILDYLSSSLNYITNAK